MDIVEKVKNFLFDLFWINRIRNLANLHGKRLYQLLLVQAWMMLFMYVFAIIAVLVNTIVARDFSVLFSLLGLVVFFPLLFRLVAFTASKLNGLPF